jgi:hypothetical protein
LVELLTITVQTFFWFVDIGRIVYHHCQNFLLFCQNKRKFIKQRWSTIPPISTKQKKVYQTEIVNNSTNINKPKESFNSDGILVELLTITVKTFFCFVDIGGIVDHHCSNFLLFC